jgi:hypothetical protein
MVSKRPAATFSHTKPVAVSVRSCTVSASDKLATISAVTSLQEEQSSAEPETTKKKEPSSV